MYRVTFLILLLSSAVATAQSTRPAVDSLRIYLMTIGPGEAAYEKFGHNQIWVHDPAAGTDIAYNYGVFDFEQENFIWRFIQGRMLYRCEPVDAGEIERIYREHYPDASLSAEQWLALEYLAAERAVWVQELNLPPDAARALADFLAWNVRPENKHYRYDYYRDNCSTRVRDALDRQGVLDGQIRRQLEDVPTPTTFRWHTRRLTRTDLPLYAALYAVLGQPADAPIDAWEESFLPVKLMEHLRQVKVTDETGALRPLVRREYALSRDTLYPEPDAPPAASWLWALALGVILGTLTAGMGGLSAEHRTARVIMAVLVGGWSLLAGVGGSIGTWAWFTDHAAAHMNENWLQLNPASLVLVVVGPWVALKTPVFRRGRWRAFEVAYWSAAVVLGLSVLGLIGQALPGMNQVNGEVLCLTVPMHAGVFIAIRSRARAQRVPASAAVA